LGGKHGRSWRREQGISREDDWWEYVPTAEGRVVVEARDLAGNVVKVESRRW